MTQLSQDTDPDHPDNGYSLRLIFQASNHTHIHTHIRPHFLPETPHIWIDPSRRPAAMSFPS